MARLGSRAKAGFYPTPDSVCELLKSKISFEEGARLLDPCCGKGKTLSRLANGAQVTTYGIELDHQRANEARSRINKVLWGDSLSEIMVSPGSFSLLYLNPPYDTGISDGEKAQRLEVQFLRRYLNSLQNGGKLVLVIPYYILKHCAKILSRHFKAPVIIGFPEDEFQAFKQCIVIGNKRMATKEQADMTQDYLEELAAMEPEEFLSAVNKLDLIAANAFCVPAAVKSLTTFKSVKIDPLEILPLVHKAGILQRVLIKMTPRQNNEIHPLTPLKKGHRALMLAGGYVNDAIEKDGRQLVIKGSVKRVEEVVNVRDSNSDDIDGIVTTMDKGKPTVKVIDMQTAELFVVE